MMAAGREFTLCRTGRGLAASRRPFGDARSLVRHGAEVEPPPRHQAIQSKKEVLTFNRDLTSRARAIGISGTTPERIACVTTLVGNPLSHRLAAARALRHICCGELAVTRFEPGLAEPFGKAPFFAECSTDARHLPMQQLTCLVNCQGNRVCGDNGILRLEMGFKPLTHGKDVFSV